MTSCKEINKGKNKPNIFDVQIDLSEKIRKIRRRLKFGLEFEGDREELARLEEKLKAKQDRKDGQS